MTLLEWASPWDNSNSSNNKNQNDSNDNSKKRTSTMVHSMKKINESSTNDIDSSRYSNVKPHLETFALRSQKTYNDNDENKIMVDSMKVDEIVNDQRKNNINKLIEKMTLLQVTDDGSGLTNFNPPTRPEINKKNDKEFFASNSTEMLDSKQNKNGLQTITPKDLLPNKQSEAYSSLGNNSNYIPVNSPIFKGTNGIDSGNYRKIYDSHSGSSNAEGYVPYYARSNYGSESKSSIGDDQLLKKINYMIHLLEEQRKEKTDNVTEEFLLYSFFFSECFNL